MIGAVSAPGPHAPPPDVRARAAVAADAPAVAALLAESLGEKYRPAYGPRAPRAIEALVRAEIEGGASGYVVATSGHRVVGTAHLSTANDTGVPAWQPTLRRAVGAPRALWAGVVLSLLWHGPLAADEAYVGEVAVDPEWRRRGVATTLMTAVEDLARGRGCRVASLWVTLDNAAARALYEGRGFREVRRRRLPLGRRLFGAGGMALMHLRLDDAPQGPAGLRAAPA